MKRYIVIILVFLLLVGTVICMLINHKRYDRTLEDFYPLKMGMTHSEVISIVGEPDGRMGSGIIRPFYILNDGSLVMLTYKPPKEMQSESTICQVAHQDKNGNVTIICSN